jgi:hypothetical protein
VTSRLTRSDVPTQKHRGTGFARPQVLPPSQGGDVEDGAGGGHSYCPAIALSMVFTCELMKRSVDS